MCRVGIGSPLPDLTFRRLPSGLGLQKLKHELALWIPLRHTNTELTWGTWAASALLICRDNGQHTVRPWCGLSALRRPGATSMYYLVLLAR